MVKRGERRYLMIMSTRSKNGKGGVVVLSRQKAEDMADEKARSMLGVSSRKDAFRMLDDGELAGKGVEAEFKRLRFLLS